MHWSVGKDEACGVEGADVRCERWPLDTPSGMVAVVGMVALE